MKNYDQLKKVIQEAVPEIMELKFGCEVYVDWGDKKGKVVLVSEPNEAGFARWELGAIATKNRKECKILGRPIRLADVLVAINKNVGPNLLNEWNLTDNNLDHQSDELKTFLIKLLCE